MNPEETEKHLALIKMDPPFPILEKDGSRLMRFLGWLLFWVDFGTYSTSFAGRVWLSRGAWVLWSENEPLVIPTLKHEFRHLRDERRSGYLPFWIAYLLLPLPVGITLRAGYEFRGYRETIRWIVELGYLADDDIFLDHITRQFTGPAYLWMWPFKRSVRRRLKRYLDEARAEFADKGDDETD